MMKGKTIALIIVLIAIAGSIYYLESGKASLSAQQPDTLETEGNNQQTQINSNESRQALTPYRQWERSLTAEDRKRIADKEKLYQKVPELAGISGYLNAPEGMKISDFRGKVVLVDFWTYTCINCIRTLPYLTEWDRRYRDEGLVIIGVHTPEFEFEKEYDNVKMAMGKYGIGYRVVQDNDYATWKAFGNRFWPRKYLVDADGFIRYDHIGEGGYTETEQKIQELLMERGARLGNMSTTQLEDKTPRRQQTPELYAGYGFALPRGQDIGNPGGMRPGEAADYLIQGALKNDAIYLNGRWQSNEDNLEAKEGNAAIMLAFTASSANIVALKQDTPLKLFVGIDGQPVSKEQAGDDVIVGESQSYILVAEPRLYNAVNGAYGTHLLTLAVEREGFAFSAFTFG
ncbi:TPA: thioredoxin family protein [Candidatus Woesearchaeota archaeon]|nr:thioredoxin family protein [Candidatus Woesearchaeota archaeon]